MTARIERPTCEGCGCTEADPCPGGCAWDPDCAAIGRAVCTRCAPLLATIAALGIPPAPYVLLLGDAIAELPA